MPKSFHVGDVGVTIILNIEVDNKTLSVKDVSKIDINITRPDNTTTKWNAELDTKNNLIKYKTRENDLTQAGEWKVYPVIYFTDSKRITGTADSFLVINPGTDSVSD